MSLIALRINGITVHAQDHDTVLAVLINQGIRWTRRDLDNQPRFALCGMGVCQECAVRINGQTGQLACLRRCTAGMEVQTDV